MMVERKVKICVSCYHENSSDAQRCEKCKSIVLNPAIIMAEAKGSFVHALVVNAVPVMLVLTFLLFAARMYIKRSEYESTTRIKNSEELEDILKNEQKPVLIYFYYRSYDNSPKFMLSALDRVNAFIGHRMPIYRYRYNKREDLELMNKYGMVEKSEIKKDIPFFKMKKKEGVSEPIKKEYVEINGTFVLFEKGVAEKSMVVETFFDKKDPANAGQIFLFIKDVLNLRELSRFEKTKLEYLDSESFYDKVINASNPVVVNFTRSTCPASNGFREFYKIMADDYRKYADFYYVDTSKEKEIVALFGVWATPVVIIYNNGVVVGRYKGACSSQYANDSRLFGHLFTLLVDYIML